MSEGAEMTKTIHGVTYHQDPRNSTLWYDDKTKIGSGSGWNTTELREITSQLRWLEREIAKLDPNDWEDAGAILEYRDQINDCDEEIEVLKALAG
jgi:hypothetical protein